VDGAHPHLIVNHVPVVASAIGVLLLVVAHLRRTDRGMLDAALIVLVVAGLGAVAAFLTGDPAEHRVRGIPGVDEASIEEHHSIAWIASAVSVATAIGAVWTWARTRRVAGPPSRRWMAVLFLLAVASAALLAWTSNVGGVIRHTEIR
jgi:hypothetical protein